MGAQRTRTEEGRDGHKGQWPDTRGQSLSRAGASTKARSPAQALSAQEEQEWHPCRGQPRVGVRAGAQ